VAAAAAGPGEVELAVAFYNEAASKHRYRKCTTLTPQLRKRLAGRLKDIGGLENFKQAVLAVPRHRFLSGQAPKRAEDDAPFKLNIDVLLQTDGPKLGDVLHTLLDLASDEPAGAPSTKPPDTDLAPFLATLKANPSTAKHVSDERLLRVLQSVPLEEWKAYLPPDRLLSLTKGSTQ
jgi:hypothetical protein